MRRFRPLASTLPRSLKAALWRGWLQARTFDASQRMLPAFIIIGAQKGGTTSLYNYLIQHPQIAAAQEKEIRFFDYKYANGLDWYRAHFPRRRSAGAPRTLISGEASPNYLYDPRPPARIAQLLPDVRLIVLLRNPVDRAFSSYQMNIRRGYETLGFAEALAAEAERLDGELERVESGAIRVSRARQYYSYIDRGRYAEQLERWLRYFARDRLLLLRSEDFFTRPAEALCTTLAFLDLPEHAIDTHQVHNAGHYAELDPVLRTRLQAEFVDHNRRLAALTGLDWGWDQ